MFRHTRVLAFLATPVPVCKIVLSLYHGLTGCAASMGFFPRRQGFSKESHWKNCKPFNLIVWGVRFSSSMACGGILWWRNFQQIGAGGCFKAFHTRKLYLYPWMCSSLYNFVGDWTALLKALMLGGTARDKGLYQTSFLSHFWWFLPSTIADSSLTPIIPVQEYDVFWSVL